MSPKVVKNEIAAKLIYDILLKMSTCFRVQFKRLYEENSETERFLGAYVGILESSYLDWTPIFKLVKSQ